MVLGFCFAVLKAVFEILLLSCLLICRGAKPGAVDSAGKTPLECAVEKGGAITDEELFIMLSETSR